MIISSQLISNHSTMKVFPIDFFFDQILGILFAHQTIVLVGETGSGKTTRLPHFLYFSGFYKNKKICCTQPRRLATISVARKISHDMAVCIGTVVGYSIRFEDCTTEKTKVKFITDGLLIREWLSNPFLDDYSILILDEAHERSTNTDLILTLCKSLVRIRFDFKLIITSATLNIEKYSKFFSNCPVLCIPGRSFLVKIYYNSSSIKDFLTRCYSLTARLLKNTTKGDILVFLTGKNDIDTIGNLLFFLKKNFSKNKNFEIFPIFSNLPNQWQTDAVKSYFFGRKVILATNIVETSLTIPGISFVIDSGFSKQKIFNPYSSLSKLITLPISQNNAIQRAGRSGRTRPGKCFRIYSKWNFNNDMSFNSCPDIQKIDINHDILFLKGTGISNLLTFEWIDSPSIIFLFRSIKILYSLGALGRRGNITFDGKYMVKLPMDPMLSKVFLSSYAYFCTNEMLSLISCLLLSFQLENFFFFEIFIKQSICVASDHLLFLFFFLNWKSTGYAPAWCCKFGINPIKMNLARNTRAQISNIFKIGMSELSKKPSCEGIVKSFLSGYFLNLAIIQNERQYTPVFCTDGMFGQLHPGSVLNCSHYFPTIILYGELIFSKKPYLKIVSGIRKKWLLDLIQI